jgi:CRP/FNR family transcriptional regulator, cyclic AMP receptor protein
MPTLAIPLLSALSPPHLDYLNRAGVLLDPADGTEVFAQGDPADAVYGITGGDGHVRIGSADPDGKGLMVEIIRRGDIFGEMGVINGDPRTATALVHGRVRLLRIPGPVFLDVLSQSPALGIALARLLSRRLRRTYELFQDATFETLEVRLARQVLYLAHHESRPTEQGLRLTFRLRQGDLADLLGATTRSIITILNTWRASGLVTYDAERAFLTIRDPASLRALIEHDPAS